ncbi:MAG: FAD-dependent oxidoreductase [Kiritimatiellaceae bacterium]|nr:FAD-dependent oxidoreductase [Kiritimatiellaceae bacterium]
MASIRKIPCIVSKVVDHGQQVYGVTLEPQERLPRFSAGQFLHFTLDPYDPAAFWPESRVFSIASSPNREGPIEILYSVKGRYTTRMEQEIQVGKEVWIKLPYGDFILDDLTHPRILFAGGTGISAFSSLLDAIRNAGQKSPVTLVYGIRNPQLFFYKEVVEALTRMDLCDRVFLFVENGTLETSSSRLCIKSGRIDLDAIWPEMIRAADTDFYLAGPPAMLSMLEDKLRSKNVDASRIVVDKWE